MNPRVKLFAAAALMSGMMSVSAADAASSTFTVLYGGMDGSDLGTQTIEITQNGEETKVTLKSDLSAFFGIYSFQQDSTEVYRNGQMVSVTSRTEDTDYECGKGGGKYMGGNNFDLSGQMGADGLDIKLVAKDGRKFLSSEAGDTGTRPVGIVPASLWSMETVKQTNLLNTIDGRIMTVSTSVVGPETVKVKDADVQATHYKVSGDINRDLWFDANGNLVQYRLTACDGKDVFYVLR